MSFGSLLALVLWVLIVANGWVFWKNVQQWRVLERIRLAEFEIMVMMWQMRNALTAEQVHHLRMLVEFEAFKQSAVDEER